MSIDSLQKRFPIDIDNDRITANGEVVVYVRSKIGSISLKMKSGKLFRSSRWTIVTNVSLNLNAQESRELVEAYIPLKLKGRIWSFLTTGHTGSTVTSQFAINGLDSHTIQSTVETEGDDLLKKLDDLFVRLRKARILADGEEDEDVIDLEREIGQLKKSITDRANERQLLDKVARVSANVTMVESTKTSFSPPITTNETRA